MNDILRLHHAGYRLVFLPAGGKVPDRKGWQTAILPDDYVEQQAAEVPHYRSVGIIHGPQASGTIDIETDSEVAEQQWDELTAGIDLPPHPTFASTKSTHHIFAFDPAFAEFGATKWWNGKAGVDLEFKFGSGKASFSVIPPSEGRDWIVPLDDKPPAMPQAMIDRIVAKFAKCEKSEPEPSANKSADDWFDQVTTADDRATAIRALWALNPTRADNRDEWMRVAMALKSVSDDLFDEFDKWSQQSSKYGETRKTWNSIGSGDVTLGTLLYMAKQDNPEAAKPKSRYDVFGVAELLADTPDPIYIIADILVEQEPSVMAGASKMLKTSIALDAAISLASGTKFLNHWPTVARRCLFMSGESGRRTLKTTLKRICRARNLDPKKLQDALHFTTLLPRFYLDTDLSELRDLMTQLKTEVIFIDPAYKCMKGGTQGDLQAQGEQLWPICELCQSLGVTIVILHHCKRSTKIGQLPELEDMTGSGFAESFRQWALLNRREKYHHDGNHALYLVAGGSAGHDGVYYIDVSEGKQSDPDGRKWEVAITTEEALNRGAAEAELAQQQTRIRKALKDGPLTKSPLCKAAKVKADELEAVLSGMADVERIIKLHPKNKTEQSAWQLKAA